MILISFCFFSTAVFTVHHMWFEFFIHNLFFRFITPVCCSNFSTLSNCTTSVSGREHFIPCFYFFVTCVFSHNYFFLNFSKCFLSLSLACCSIDLDSFFFCLSFFSIPTSQEDQPNIKATLCQVSVSSATADL